MLFNDFEYDGIKLSDMGYVICTFGSKGLETVSSGSQLKFNTIATHNGEKHKVTSVEYEDCIETTFAICKKLCGGRTFEITKNEYRHLMGWLNRKQFHTLKIVDGDFENVFLNASFNVSRIEMNGKLYGLELNMITDKPYGVRQAYQQTLSFTNGHLTQVFHNESEVEGIIYPKVVITVGSTGNLDVLNALENRHTYIANCTQNEVITMEYPIIQTSLAAHKIQNDFNWNFFRLASTFTSKDNYITTSIPCTIKLTYNPVVNLIV